MNSETTSVKSSLPQGVLSKLETLAQSIAGIAPSATPGMLLPIVFGFAGNGTWLAYLLATIGILFTAKCINEFASRQACPGSLYTFTAQGLGKDAGNLCGWALLFAYIFCGAACVAQFTIYALEFFEHLNLFTSFHLKTSLTNSFGMMIFCSSLVGFVAWKNIKMSAALMLRLEFLSISLILLVVALCLAQSGFKPDMSQILLKGITLEQVRMGLVMAIFGFVAFESAASLGEEAADPLRSIPRAIIQSVIISGLFFVITSYVMIQAFRGASISLNKCATPLLTMSELAGVPFLGHLIDAGIMLSFFAAGLANLNAAARALFKMSEDGLFHNYLAKLHNQNQTPHLAVATASLLSLSISLCLAATRSNLLDIVGWLGSLATFGFIYAYLSASIAAALFLKKSHLLNWSKVLVVSISILILMIALLGSVYPAPVYPYNILPFIFAGYMLVCWLVHNRKPKFPV